MKAFVVMALWIVLETSSPLWAEGLPWPTAISDAADASLRACTASTIDRFWSVGDRGLIMSSRDGGRVWEQIPTRDATNLTTVEFADENHGWIGGGFIWPLTNRSIGTLRHTSDGGNHWHEIETAEIAKINGLKSFGPQSLLAWGDWSVLHQSSLLESSDGGNTFFARPVPCSHLACAAWLNPMQGVIVDRLSRVFVCQNGGDFQQLILPCNPSQPILAADSDGLSVWLVGEGGQLYTSQNLKVWKRIELTIAAADKALLQLRSVHVRGNNVWVTTNLPGVILTSEDGLAFTVMQTGSTAVLHDLFTVGSQQTVAVGSMNNIIETRNGGIGWWSKFSGGARTSLLAVAARASDLPLDALVYASAAQKRQSAALLVHSQDEFQSADAWPDAHTRIDELRSVLTVSELELFRKFPIGSLTGSVPRANDLVGYQNIDRQPSPIERELVVQFRSQRPDMVLICGSSRPNALIDRCNAAVMEAVRLAGESSYNPFTIDSPLELPVWKISRVIRRTDRRTTDSVADWAIEPNSLLGQTGQSVADRVRIAACLNANNSELGPLLDPYFDLPKIAQETPSAALLWNRPGLYGDYWSMGGSRRPASQSRNFFSGLPDDPATHRTTDDSKVRNLQVLKATMMQANAFADLTKTNLTTAVDRDKWLYELSTFSGTLASEERSRYLLELANVKLASRDWGAACKAIELLMLEPKESVWKEIAAQWILQTANSREFAVALGDSQKVWQTTQQTALQHTAANASRIAVKTRSIGEAIEASAVQPAAFVSPFEAMNPSLGSPTPAVVTAGYMTSAQPLVIENDRASETQENTEQSTVESNSLAPHVVPAYMQILFEQTLRNDPRRRSDPRSVLAGHARLRDLNVVSNQKQAQLQSPLKLLALSHSLMGWTALIKTEEAASLATLRRIHDHPAVGSANNVARPSASTAKDLFENAKALALQEQRPNLDGVLDDALWRDATELTLVSPWQSEAMAASQLKLCRDDQFIYVALYCPVAQASNAVDANAKGSKIRQRDADLRELDHVQLRFDIDRDYYTWFEFSVASNGQTRESLNGLASWNPKWYVADRANEEFWTAEFAIPITEIFGEAIATDAIAILVQRSIPGVGVQTISSLPSDRILPQSATLLRLP